MDLNYKQSGNGSPLLILHGLFGMLDNWITFARTMSAEYSVYLIDQRNHGNSPHSEAHSYQLMADDLWEFCRKHKLERITLIGHSMGGKTAIRFALDHPEVIQALIIVDMGVKAYPGGHESIFRALRAMDLSVISSRKDAEDALAESIAEPGVRQFLLKNLTRSESGGYTWKFNLNALYTHYDQILEAIPEDSVFEGRVMFIRGGNSGYIRNEDWDGIQRIFPKAALMTIPNAGHWVHADEPEQLIAVVRKFLSA